MRAGVGKTDPLPVFMDEAFSFRMPVAVRPGIDMPDQRLHHSAPLQFETTGGGMGGRSAEIEPFAFHLHGKIEHRKVEQHIGAKRPFTPQ